MAQFTTIKLAGDRVLLRGEDQFGNIGKTVLDSAEWNELKTRQSHQELHANFDDKVQEFFAPLMEAIDTLHQLHDVQTDPLFYVVMQEKEAAVAGQAEELFHLSKDSAVLRLLEQDSRTERLVWISDTDIEILEAEPQAKVPAFTYTDGGDSVFDAPATEGTEPTA